MANLELTPELALGLGRAAARVLRAKRFVVGRDTRQSGTLLEAALSAGLASEGVDVELLGVAPTPAVAWLCAADDVAGAMISASHNAFADNGIKLFGPGGRKLSDEVEAKLEAELDGLMHHQSPVGAPPVGVDVGALINAKSELARYEAALVGVLAGRRLDGVRVVIDCANGAASAVAADVLRRLGAIVIVIHDSPDGANINARCGSTYPADLQASVVSEGAAVGLAFDGDADRVVAVDERGQVIDGDHLIAMCAIDLRQRAMLRDETVVVTVMTNLGFRLAMAERGIRVVETPVGDRHVLEALDAGGYSLGGEQSGHVIFRDLATTGDGLLTGIAVLDLLVRSGRPLHELAGDAMTRLPQVLRNVALKARDPGLIDALAPFVRHAEAELGAHGRVLVRPSGTEPLVRVMVEAPTMAQAEQIVERLVAALQQLAGSR